MTALSSSSGVFKELILLNPWARELWEERTSLIHECSFNINFFEQGGNAKTNDWLKKFTASKSHFLRQQIYDGSLQRHVSLTMEIVRDVVVDQAFALADVGTQMIQLSESSWSVNRSEKIVGYGLGQFKADLLALVVPSIRDLEFDREVVLDNIDLGFGLQTLGVTFRKGFRACNARFGWSVDLRATKFSGIILDESVFEKGLRLAPSTVEGPASFRKTQHQWLADFCAVHFNNSVDFSDSEFLGDASFEGAFFGGDVDLSRTVFRGKSIWCDTTSRGRVTMADARFPGVAYIARSARKISRLIEASDHTR